MTVGASMERCRKARGLTQKELARRANVSEHLLGRYERDEILPGLYNLRALADALEISLDEYVGRKIKKGEHAYADQ